MNADATAGAEQHGTARAALRHRRFRILFIGATLSNVGTWMQNFTLPAYIDSVTGSASLVGLLVFVQLGPLLLLSIPAGVLADRTDRTRLVTAMQAVMMAMSIVLAVSTWASSPLWTLFVIQGVIGIANTVQAPAFSASIPLLVDRRDIPGAVSLNSAMINGSRILGPTLAAALAALGVGIPGLFAVNAVTYLFLVVPIVMVRLPSPAGAGPAKGFRALTAGAALARRRRSLSRVLLSMSIFSFVCLPYIGLFPSVARLNLGLSPDGSTYKFLYIVWGLGAFLGSIAVGTVLSSARRRDVIVRGYALFACFLAVFAVLRSPVAAFPVAAALGFVYFMTATALVTVLQENLLDRERASVMPLWFMAFGGTIPFGNLIAGPIMDAIGARWVLGVGALTAVALSRWTDLDRLTPDDFLPVDEGDAIAHDGPTRLL
ncbi:MAG: MFS transporter [Ilumatobacteraceae bacterium]